LQAPPAKSPGPRISQAAPAKSAVPRGLLDPRFPLPWTHYVSLLAVRSAHARAFYEAEALRGGWSSRQLDRQIGSMFYERRALSRDKAVMLAKGARARPSDATTAEQEIKAPYVLEFLGLKDEYSESEMEEAKLTHADAGQMHVYLNYAGEHWTMADENPPVGLILCAQGRRDGALCAGGPAEQGACRGVPHHASR
jgi:hypothetical protein